MIISCFGIDYNVANPIITIGAISFDLTKVNESYPTHEGELGRIYLSVLGHEEQTKVSVTNETDYIIVKSAKDGIDLATATFEDILNYLNTSPTRKSESMKELCRKVMKLKSKTKFTNESNLVSKHLKNEYLLIDAEPVTIETLGQCGGGFLGKIRLDGSSDRIPRRMV